MKICQTFDSSGVFLIRIIYLAFKQNLTKNFGCNEYWAPLKTVRPEPVEGPNHFKAFMVRQVPKGSLRDSPRTETNPLPKLENP